MKALLRKLFHSKMDGKKGLTKKTNYIIIIGLVGLLLLIVSNVFTKKTDPTSGSADYGLMADDEKAETVSKKVTATKDVADLEGNFEKDIKEMLEKIQGISEVEVMVNLDSANVKIYEKNLITGKQTTDESDTNGGTRMVEDHTEETQVVLVREGDKEVPLLVQTKKPKVRGVFVVAKGVDHPTRKQWVIESVARVLDVSTHRVSVMPKN